MENPKEFEAIYLKYYPQLFVYGKSFCTHEQLIEDTIQELFLALWQKQSPLLLTSSLENYLYVSFRNNLIRKLKAQQTVLFSDTFNETELEKEDEVQSFKEKKLSKLLQKLPARQKEVLFLRYYKNKSYHEIADTLDISYQVARNFAYRAIKFLKKRMKDFQLSDTLLFLLCCSTYLQAV